MKLSITGKIFLGFALVFATFGAVVVYGAFTMRRLGDELRLVSRGYLELRLEVTELQQGQSNLIKVLSDQRDKGRQDPAAGARPPRFVKFAIDDARRVRLKQQMPVAIAAVRGLESLRSSPEERTLLAQVKTRLERIDSEFRADEALFDAVYGPVGDPPLVAKDPEAARELFERLFRREQGIKRDLAYLSAELRLRAQQASLLLEAEENRAVWATLAFAVVAAFVALLVAILATRTLRPLRRLAERAKEIARGDYRQRVDASAPDEIGALAREFNAMAAALDEREQLLIRSERLAAVGKIAAQITHEVRNPLSSIGLNAEMLEEELANLDGPKERIVESRALARSIVKEVDRLTEITEGYLRLARLPRPKLEREDLGEIVHSLVAFMAPELSARGTEIAVDVPPGLMVAADEQQLRQALLNLMRNALDAMPRGGRVELSATRTDTGVSLRVRDTGQGIAPEHLSKIFDPFFSTKDGGTGLGLALTQQIIAEHGGTIEVLSALGEGTTFLIVVQASP